MSVSPSNHGRRPIPTLSLTIPSLYDGTPLDCRLYHPVSLSSDAHSLHWRGDVAVVAHPYAPMGGCYDDAIVEAIVFQLLEAGFLVGTFNFRGAAHSAGKTSWTARPERDDYASFVAFLAHYTTRIQDAPQDAILLMGGYSYGAMVTTQLAPLDSLLEPLVAPSPGSNAADIRLRAEQLALQAGMTMSRSATGMKRFGGGDQRRRKSCDGASLVSEHHHSRLPRSVCDIFARTRPRHHQQHERGRRRWMTRVSVDDDEKLRAKSAPAPMTPTSPSRRPRAAYLLVSPLQGLASRLATLSTSSSSSATTTSNLVANPSLAIYAGRDALVPAAKVRSWASRLAAAPGSQFRALEVARAGHFWTEDGALAEVEAAVASFAAGLTSQSDGIS
ncbi:hypothetical protein L249_5600 [Ophiocordyceps polyrhachis-furcata BCC 54312]|uniref:Xaa-Pro dipeptidyl-peptidase-like domain-containing protein n=1 Tax=Ophiocordyceps polyrhachis-furcata BCC 54312 TaxID=1330021 RepID=A0A367LGI9_9HYPO|nr:hypothetical protein L249_5600 [Ophiocordyceps polyrhachis-furcata BCC 54312]